MCHQVTYTLPCEHVKTQIIYCADATATERTSAAGTGSPRAPGSVKAKQQCQQQRSHASLSNENGEGSRSRSPARKQACANLTMQSQPYPTPPSFRANPASFFSSSLSPRCPLGDGCPFEQKNRCWNCCWCGKGWNETGRCGCVMLIEGNQVRCEHLCCWQCEPAAQEEQQPQGQVAEGASVWHGVGWVEDSGGGAAM